MRADEVCRAARGFAPIGLALAIALGGTSSARAFCRATTCDPTHETCPVDEHGCDTTGLPLFWPAACFAVWMPSDPEPLPGVDAQTFADLTQSAFDTWRDADCAPGTPALEARIAEGDECIAYGGKRGRDSLSTVSVVTDVWPHPGGVNDLALTTVSFTRSTGVIRGFDIELNAADHDFTTSNRDIDLQSALTHEAGHGLGLGHSDVARATMFPSTGHSTDLRTLDRDDERAICSLYPPDPGERSACASDAVVTDAAQACAAVASEAALSKSTPGCNCDVRHAGASGAGAWFASLVSLVLLWRRRAATSRAAGSTRSPSRRSTGRPG